MIQDSEIDTLIIMSMANPWSDDMFKNSCNFKFHSQKPDYNMDGGTLLWVGEHNASALIICSWLRHNNHKAVLIWDLGCLGTTCQRMIWTDRHDELFDASLDLRCQEQQEELSQMRQDINLMHSMAAEGMHPNTRISHLLDGLN